MALPKRKNLRLTHYDYGQPGSYFLTVCTENKAKLLGEIVGGGVLDTPHIRLSSYGTVVERITRDFNDFYADIAVDAFVIMPNHVHLLLTIHPSVGSPRTATPTIPSWMGAWKRKINREVGRAIWQRSYYDHIVRGEQDYGEIWQYIANNPARWQEDSLYI